MTNRDKLKELLKQAQDKYFELCSEYARDSEGKTIESFEDFCADHLLANGVIVPPCKVGQTIWLIKSLNWQQTKWGIKEGKISMIQQKADKSWKFRVTENHSVQDYTVDKIGKIVFLTKEEAEAELRKRGVSNAENN